MNTTQISKALKSTLLWESSRMDPDQKPLRNIEWAAVRMNDLADLNAQYHAQFEGLLDASSLPAIREYLDAHPEVVSAAKTFTQARLRIRHEARKLRARGEATETLLVEWTALLATRYPAIAGEIRQASNG